jgi:hypothetical protein
MRTSGRKTVKAGKTSAPMAVKATTAKANGAGGGNAQARSPSFDEIAKRSYELFLARGGLDGHDVEDWLQAEAELRTE